ncbi:Uncharacterised protein [Fusobacterium necrogenes]|uniref:HTH cro/C1-type domain-containing protein n=1 Tax=Fusobacterium necrogenes TaxID=858 RepID=A0A377GWB0_9FUSO|nr:tetratricopeptide repeat protein [Fusobacterium necrogenes]STO31216.1 Uncharacterised protein [Fusobacterium necrogenes]
MFLSPEEKLLKLRKKYKITQGELVGEDITRVFLGMIEIGKRSLTEKTAKLLCKNFHKILKEKGINDKISLEELMKSKEQQAIEFLNNMLISEIDISNENLWIIEEALYELQPKEREIFCENLYLRFKRRKRYFLAIEYLLKSFHGVRKIQNLHEKLQDMFYMCEQIKDPLGFIYTYRRFSSWLPKEKLTIDNEKLKYSYAKALLDVKEYDEALEIINFLYKKSKNDETIYIVRNLLARALREQNKIADSIKEYSSLAKGRNSKEKCLAYAEIIKIGLTTSDNDLIKKYYEKAKSIIHEVTGNTLETLNILYTLAKGTKRLGKIKDTKSYYMEALVIGKNIEDSLNLRVEIIGELFEVLDKSDFYSVQSIELEYLELLKNTANYEVSLKILNYYKKFLPNELPKKIELFLNTKI